MPEGPGAQARGKPHFAGVRKSTPPPRPPGAARRLQTSGAEVFVTTLKVRDVMSADVIRVGRKVRLAEVRELMDAGRFRHVPVVDDDDEVIGVISDRDLARVIGLAAFSRAEARLEQLTAESVMSAPVETVDPDEALTEAAERMLDGRFGCLPVVEGRHLVGIITESDFVRLATNR